MKNLALVSLVAMFSMFGALGYVYVNNFGIIMTRSEESLPTYTSFDPIGLPMFFGVAMFMYEGNAVALEIYNQMEDRQKSYPKALAGSLGFATFMIILTGGLCYSAYGNEVKDIVLLSLPRNPITAAVQIAYSLGVLCSYALQISPAFKILKMNPIYQQIPEGNLKLFGTRFFIVVLCSTMAYQLPNLGQFLNFQGAIVSTLLTIICPIAFYLKTFGDEISVKEKLLLTVLFLYGLGGGCFSGFIAFNQLIVGI